MTSFLYIRHGKTESGKAKQIPTVDTPLAKEGRAQAREAAKVFKTANVVTIATSPFPRAVETAEIIAKELGIQEIHIIDELRERGFGDLEGTAKKHESEWYFTIDGQDNVESLAALTARSRMALKKILPLTAKGKLLVVGHATAGFYLQQVALGRNLGQFEPPYELKNAEYVEVEVLRRPFAFSKLFIVAAIAMLIITAIALLSFLPQPQNPTGGPQIIPLTAEDYNGDPNLQGAIQKQLQQQTGSPQQTGDEQPSTKTGNLLQPGGVMGN